LKGILIAFASCKSVVDTEENDNGRILAAYKAILRVCLEIISVYKSKETPDKNKEN